MVSWAVLGSLEIKTVWYSLLSQLQGLENSGMANSYPMPACTLVCGWWAECQERDGGRGSLSLSWEAGHLWEAGLWRTRALRLLLMPLPVFFPLSLQPAVGTIWSLRSQVPRFCPHLPRTASPIMPRLTLSLCRVSLGATPMLCLRCPQGQPGMGPPEWIFLGHGSASRRSLARASLGR